MRIGIIIPSRGDRPLFLQNCLRMLDNQTVKPFYITVVDQQPKDNRCDITYRYRNGYDRCRNKGLDVIALMEDDDYYAPDYLETMIKKWEEFGRPDMLGTNHTIYYHIKLFAHFTMHHLSRSSAMSTLIKPDLNFNWCSDNEPFTDIHLWHSIGNKGNGNIFQPDKTICLGIKHGVGLCGGASHVDRLGRYTNLDHDHSFLKGVMDEDSYKFYSNYFKE